MAKLVYFNHIRRTGGTFLRTLLKKEFKDKMFIGYPKSIQEAEFILSDKCICYSGHFHTGGLYRGTYIDVWRHEFVKRLNLEDTYQFALLRHPIKRIYSALQKQNERIVDIAVDGDSGRFSALSRVIGCYSRDFSVMEEGGRLAAPSIELVLRYLLTGSSDVDIKDWENEKATWLIESIFALAKGNKEDLKRVVRERGLTLEGRPNTLSPSLKEIAERYDHIGIQENMRHTVDVLHKDGILSAEVRRFSGSKELAAVNVSKVQCERLSDQLCYDFYQAFPYDFALWSEAYYNSRR